MAVTARALTQIPQLQGESLDAEVRYEDTCTCEAFLQRTCNKDLAGKSLTIRWRRSYDQVTHP
jgi:hypothetical protein